MAQNGRDLLGLPINPGDTILGITGIDRKIHTVKEVFGNYLMTENGSRYMCQNVLVIDDIIKANAEYFV